MGKVPDKMIQPDWVGDIHDAQCLFEDIEFDSTKGVLSIRCWRPVGGHWRKAREVLWEELLIQFERLAHPPTVRVEDMPPSYELSTICFDPEKKRVHICFHYSLSIEYSADKPEYSYRGPTGQRRKREEIFGHAGFRRNHRK